MGLKDGFWKGREIKADADVRDPALRGGRHNSGRLKTGSLGEHVGTHRAPDTSTSQRDSRDADRGRERG